MNLPEHFQKSHRWRLRHMERRTLLVLGDFIVGVISLLPALVFWAASADWLGFSIAFLTERVPAWFYALPLFWLVLLVELYDNHRATNRRETIRGIASAALVGLVLYALIYLTSPPKSLPRRGVAAFLISASGLTFVWRMIYIRVFTLPQFMRRVLLVGGGKAGQTILRVINHLEPPPFHLIGIVDDDPQKIGTQIEKHPVLGDSDCLLETVNQEQVSEIMVAISGEMQGSTFQRLIDAQEMGLEITRMPVVYEELIGRVPIRLLESDWIIRSFVDESRVSGFYQLGKRLLDIIGGAIGVLLLILLLPFVGLAILIESGLPIFYRQTRLGKGGQPYQIIKFRTMVQDAEADGKPKWAKEDDERATGVGRFLRKTHLDEVPQFINVLRGEMSMVGPRSERPELVEHFQRYVPFYRARLLVKPGITGWAQINFGYAATVDETITKLEYDLYYIKHRSLLLDLVVLLRTPGTMFGMHGQ